MNPQWIDFFEKVGKGEIDQAALASWLRSHSKE